jgi:crotonobetainyl-CoA:carnitine CoA-transferase CaiB-like acyl-CoA transferase
MTDALEGLTIIDLSSGIAAPYGTKLLADLGARIIKVERPGGDPARDLPPFLNDERGPERSATYQYLNTNKESIVIDLSRDDGRTLLGRLMQGADLVVTSWRPAVAEALGLTYEGLQRLASVPVLTVTNFGWTGPYRDYTVSDTTLFAMGGEMYSHGLAAREPLKIGGTAALLQSGAMAGVAALGALHAWEAHGTVQHVDVPLFEVQINSIDRRSSSILAWRWSGRLQERPPAPSGGLVGGVYPCEDGYVEVTASAGPYWNRFVEMVDIEELRDSQFSHPSAHASPELKEMVDALVFPWMLTHTRAEIWERARRAHALVSPIYTPKEVFEDPVFRERGLWTEIEHEVLGRLPMLGRPYALAKTPWRIRQPAPMLGQHTDSILTAIGVKPDEIVRLREEGVVA